MTAKATAGDSALAIAQVIAERWRGLVRVYAAFGEYKAEWFLRFLGLSDDSDGIHGRIKLYIEGLSDPASDVIKKLAAIASKCIEEWTKTSEFAILSEKKRIDHLAGRELLSYALP